MGWVVAAFVPACCGVASDTSPVPWETLFGWRPCSVGVNETLDAISERCGSALVDITSNRAAFERRCANAESRLQEVNEELQETQQTAAELDSMQTTGREQLHDQITELRSQSNDLVQLRAHIDANFAAQTKHLFVTWIQRQGYAVGFPTGTNWLKAVCPTCDNRRTCFDLSLGARVACECLATEEWFLFRTSSETFIADLAVRCDRPPHRYPSIEDLFVADGCLVGPQDEV
uniref:Uncharacterized protein n=1 Tax=viral metagenome TaxID=1070528 RepID=A0A6C0KBE3_9ZZZZ